jgi:hypothetical protein
MNTQTFRSRYDQLTPEERVHLVLAAVVRGDEAEVARLHDSCPRVKVVARDPAFTELLDRMWDGAMKVLSLWLDVAHRIVRYRLVVRLLEPRLMLDGVFAEFAPEYTKGRKIVIAQTHAAVVAAEEQCTKGSAAWKGIETAIARFCAERRLTTQQLFAGPCLPPAIDEARADLDAGVPADPEAEAVVYQWLCDAWPSQNARGRG